MPSKFQNKELNIIGAGPSGLTAAITAAKAGIKVTLYEKRDTVGARFNNDYQGFENWSSHQTISELLKLINININFDMTPHYHIKGYGPYQDEYSWESETPFYYLIRRGQKPGTLDDGLKKQAIDAGVTINYQNTLKHLPMGGIVCLGPRAPDAIAVGYTFNTELADGAYVIFDDKLAAKGYAYLLIENQYATLATCLFEDFHNESRYLDQTLAFFQNRLNFTMKDPHRFGGAINYILPTTAVKGKILYAGECAGFQDPLWGFGLRYAMISGYLAAQNFIQSDGHQQYDFFWKKHFKNSLKTALVNRYFYNMLGNKGYHFILKRIGSQADLRNWLYHLYKPSFLRNMIYPWVRMRLKLKRNTNYTKKSHCDCTWCRCIKR